MLDLTVHFHTRFKDLSVVSSLRLKKPRKVKLLTFFIFLGDLNDSKGVIDTPSFNVFSRSCR